MPMTIDHDDPIEVVAGLLYDSLGRVLLAARPPGKAMAGRWEFPGGKVDAGESAAAALVRELAEELGVVVGIDDCQPFHDVTFRYPGAARSVRIAAHRIRRYEGIPHGREGQALAWHAPERLHEVDILEADRPIVTALRLGTPLRLKRLSSYARVYDRSDDVHPARSAEQMVGVWVRSWEEAQQAQARGADFLLLTETMASMPAPGNLRSDLPWYAPYDRPIAGAIGSWVDDHSNDDTSIST
jgi:mutator protein MutT